MEPRQQEQLQSLQWMIEQLQRQVEQLQQQLQQQVAEQQPQQLVVRNHSHTTKKRPATLQLLPSLSRTDAKKRIVEGMLAVRSTLENSTFIIHICQFLDNESLMNASTVSKKLRQVIRDHPGMENNRIAPVLELRASKYKNDAGRTQRLVNNLIRRVSSHANFFQRYRRIEVKDIHKFDPLHFDYYKDRDQRFQLDGIQLDGIVSLDISSPSNGLSSESYPGLLVALSCMLPNLREIDMSNNVPNGTDWYYCESLLNDVTTKHPRLEKITWNSIYFYDLDLNMDTQHLKEIILDDATFRTDESASDGETMDEMSDLTHYPSSFLFCYSFGQVVERFSILNASWVDEGCGSPPPACIPQNALIKFIRNAPPSLRWFRSDLTPENIDMLRLERPLIDFE